MKYRIDLTVIQAEGWQGLEIEADSLQDACEKLKNGEGKIIAEEIDVMAVSEVRIEDIYETGDA